MAGVKTLRISNIVEVERYRGFNLGLFRDNKPEMSSLASKYSPFAGIGMYMLFKIFYVIFGKPWILIV